MFKKVLPFFVLTAILPAAAYADNPDEIALYLNIRRIGLEMSKTQVRHAAQYQDSPIQALKADSQDFVKGVLDAALEYKRNKFKWDNSLFMEYGKTTLKRPVKTPTRYCCRAICHGHAGNGASLALVRRSAARMKRNSPPVAMHRARIWFVRMRVCRCLTIR